MDVRFFATPAKFRAWLARHHATARELWVGFYKRDSGKASITWPESVDQALCFGWIDGIRKRIDDESYVIRFSPRRPSSYWSRINIDRVAELTKVGLMTDAGRNAFASRKTRPEKQHELDAKSEQRFRAKKKAWAFFTSRPPWYQRATTDWVMSAKKEETRERRLAELIESSAKEELIRAVQKLRQSSETDE